MPAPENRGGVTAAQRRRPRPYPATVAAVESLGPYLLRISLDGDGLAGFRWPGPASHLKLFLPEPGQRDVELPPADEDGLMVAEPGRPRPTTRTFTPRRWEPATGRLGLEFVLHGHGPASRWATRAQPGDQVAVSQPRRTYELLPDSRWLLLAGDESALPAIATLLEAPGPDIAVHVLVELEDSGHQVALPARAGVHERWLLRQTGERPGAALTAAVAAAFLAPDPELADEPDGLACTEARFACADFSVACACSRLTCAAVGSISASSWPALTCSPACT